MSNQDRIIDANELQDEAPSAAIHQQINNQSKQSEQNQASQPPAVITGSNLDVHESLSAAQSAYSHSAFNNVNQRRDTQQSQHQYIHPSTNRPSMQGVPDIHAALNNQS